MVADEENNDLNNKKSIDRTKKDDDIIDEESSTKIKSKSKTRKNYLILKLISKRIIRFKPDHAGRAFLILDMHALYQEDPHIVKSKNTYAQRTSRAVATGNINNYLHYKKLSTSTIADVQTYGMNCLDADAALTISATWKIFTKVGGCVFS